MGSASPLGLDILGDTLDWPFFGERHRAFAAELSDWADSYLADLPHDDVDEACRARVAALGAAGFLKAAVPAAYGGLTDKLDVRTLCLAREILAAHDGLADFAFAMQGLGTGSISIAGSEAMKQRILPDVAAGKRIAAFALSEKEAGSDVLIIDTAGRLQNKTELMAELEKIVRVLGKLDPEAPHTVLQTVDATTGQNALNQVEIFRNVAGVNGLVMTKLDGTARGGILVAIAAKHKLPVYFIGVGEQVDDLEPFSAGEFAKAIAGVA